MKRALVLLSLAAGALPGCASAPTPGAGGALRAEIYTDMNGPRVSLSEPAYVAIFQVGTSRNGARLVYPAPGAEQVPLRGGTQPLSALSTAWDLSTRYRSDVVLYMVASREPLDLSGFAASRDARAALGANMLRSNAHEIAGALAQVVVADPEGTGWTDSMLQSNAMNFAAARPAQRSRRIDACGIFEARKHRAPQSCQ